MPEQCRHTFTPEYDDTPEDDHTGGDDAGDDRWRVDDSTPGVVDGTWRCPHDAVPGEHKCIFHLPVEDRPADRDARDAFLACVRSATDVETRDERRRRLQFIDATFDGFDLSGEVIGGGVNFAIDLSHADLRGLDFTDASFRQPLRLTAVRVSEPAWVRQTEFRQRVGMRYARFEDEVRFRETEFTAPAHFAHATFETDVWFRDAVFHRVATFRNTTFRGHACFRGVDFFAYVRVSQATFHDEVTFKLAEFGDDVDFIDTTFHDAHRFTGAEFDRTTDFTGVSVAGPMDLSAASLQTLRMTPDELGADAQYVDLSGSTIRAGELRQPSDGAILYDAADATLGEVAFTHPDGAPVVEYVRLVRTTYEQFEFGSDDLHPHSTDWRIHTVFDESILPPDRRGPLSPDTLRETYLKAKNGAKHAGDSTAVGAFYYQEMTYRRKHLAASVLDGTAPPITTGSRWLRNATLMTVTGYGERPLRIVGFSGLLVVGFAGVFGVVLSPPPTAVDAVLFSFQSFITFIVGFSPQETSPLVTALSAVEGFLGAFFVALFVYAFTRRLTR
jgi:uncharacterized protein YjbI with pentapeptide repeats